MKLLPAMKRVPFGLRMRFGAAFFLQHYFGRSGWVQSLRQDAHTRIVANVRRSGPGKVIPVDRLKELSPEDFRRKYLSKGVPVVLAGAAKRWRCLQEWSFESFRQRFGHETIKLVNRKGLTDDDIVFDHEYTEEIGFADFLDQALAGRKYMRFSPLLEKFPELRNDFDGKVFTRLMGFNFGVTHHMFIGGPGTYTPLHNAITPFFFVNICGVKRWAFIPNQYLALLDPAADGFGYNHSGANVDLSNVEQFPGFDCIDRLEAVMEPGDVLFNPAWMWHCVKNDSATIGLRYGLYHPKSMVSESYLLFLVRLFAAQPNVFTGLYYSFFRRSVPQDGNEILIGKITRD